MMLLFMHSRKGKGISGKENSESKGIISLCACKVFPFLDYITCSKICKLRTIRGKEKDKLGKKQKTKGSNTKKMKGSSL